ncbi:unnamed protein product [Mytilus coruscus]|uniref:Uncharacterized protein n=1 Tax=Mytilus coruscus TaxID=42192 RepID=A0A6J8AU15_MYTCO|nr:unnamed protein product [Mytilus coruscus]
MSDESDSEIEFNMDKREKAEKNQEDSTFNTAKQGQGDIESEFNNNVRDDMARQKNKIEIERNFEETNIVLNDVNDKKINAHGVTKMSIKIGKTDYENNVLICVIAQDAILGQDFLLKFVKKIDQKKMTLHTDEDICQPQSDKLSVLVVNFNNEDIDLYPNTQLGTCDSCSKSFPDSDARCARVAVNDQESLHSQLPENLKRYVGTEFKASHNR